MPILAVEKDLDALTMTVTAEFAADVRRVWSLYADPRRLERHWGPPGWPATFVRHELVPGARSHYFMSGPDGERAHGMWVVTAVDAPRSFEVDDAFADEHGEPLPDPGFVHMRGELTPVDGGTLVVFTTRFVSLEQLQRMLEMGMEEGMRLAMGQIDGLLAEEGAAV
ncbi:MAG: SRPBCC family protein [Amnibacterium sp.]